MTIYLTALHSSTNPQPGVGTVRSLRAAYPKARIVAVDYSPRSSGIHWHEVDAVELQRPWDEMHLPAYAERIREKLDSGALWISGSDLETHRRAAPPPEKPARGALWTSGSDLESHWLAAQFPDGHPGLLSPSTASLEAVAKPAV